MEPAREALPDDVAALKAALAAERAQKLAIEAELAVARAKASEDMALIAQQRLRIAKLERQVPLRSLRPWLRPRRRTAQQSCPVDKNFPFSELPTMMRLDLKGAAARSALGRKCENGETKRRLSA